MINTFENNGWNWNSSPKLFYKMTNIGDTEQVRLSTRKKTFDTFYWVENDSNAQARNRSCTFAMINRGRLEMATSPIGIHV